MAVAIALCRAGFEAEAAGDLSRLATLAGASVQARIESGSARVVAKLADWDAGRWQRALEAVPPVFIRSLQVGTGPWPLVVPNEKRPDRVTPLVEAFVALAADPAHAPPWHDPWIEYADTNEGKALSTLARALEARLAGALGERAELHPAHGGRHAQRREPRQPHVFLEHGGSGYVGTSDPATGSPWPLGIPRIRVPGGLPSRSAHKLAEAIAVFLGDRADELLHEGQAAVDLGAAPGGWTALLVGRGLHVAAVDNGALDPRIARHPNVEHLRMDGLDYRPRRPVDWLMCDIVERPVRIATLVAEWIATGLAQRAIVNLKLPMKRRGEEVTRCEALIRDRLANAGVDATLSIRQLYHDREEVTLFVDAGQHEHRPRSRRR